MYLTPHTLPQAPREDSLVSNATSNSRAKTPTTPHAFPFLATSRRGANGPAPSPLRARPGTASASKQPSGGRPHITELERMRIVVGTTNVENE